MIKIYANHVLRVGVLVAMIISLTACGNSTTSNHANQVSVESSKATSSASSNTIPSASIKANQVSGNSSTSKSSAATTTAAPQFKTLNFGDKITTSFVEMSVDSASYSNELKPTDTSSVYSYYKDKDGETYFYITGNIKNIGANSYDVEDMNIKLTFDNKYNYTGLIAADDGGNDFYNHYVKPFGSVKYYMYSSIPDELLNSYSTCKVQFSFHDDFKHDYKTDFSEYEYCYEINLTK